MAEEQPPSLPDDLEGWLDEQAADSGRDRQEVLTRAVATYRLLAAAEDGADAEPLDQQVAALADRVDELDANNDERIEDVRDRIVQVMQVAKGKADAEHDHPDLADRIDDVAASEAEHAEDLESLQRALAKLDRQVADGFDNYESVLSTLADRADETDGKLDTLANAVVSLRRRVAELEAIDARRSAVEAIQREANSRNVAAADCEGCGKRVHVGLLSAPRCPHCEEPFAGIEPGSWFLGSATLVIGDRPALTGESVEPETAEEVFGDDD
jgi:predicted Zn-ribbon and HTH transcriptional regulator